MSFEILLKTGITALGAFVLALLMVLSLTDVWKYYAKVRAEVRALEQKCPAAVLPQPKEPMT